MTEDEFLAFFASLNAPIAQMAGNYLGAGEGDDIVAASFLTVWERRDELPADKADWAPWIVAIGRNKTRQEYQRRRRKHHDWRFVADCLAPDGGPSIEDASRSVIETTLGRSFYAQLSESEKRLFSLAFSEDVPAAAAAELLGISLTAYTTRVSRLRQKLRAHFDEREPATTATRRPAKAGPPSGSPSAIGCGHERADRRRISTGLV